MPRPLRRPKPEEEEQARQREWSRWFQGEASKQALCRTLAEVTGLPEGIAWELVRDLAEMVINRVPANLSVPAMLAIITLVRNCAKPQEASQALLTVILEELQAAHARTILENLVIAWEEAQRSPTAQQAQLIRFRLEQTIRRLEASEAPGVDALWALLEVLNPPEEP